MCAGGRGRGELPVDRGGGADGVRREGLGGVPPPRGLHRGADARGDVADAQGPREGICLHVYFMVREARKEKVKESLVDEAVRAWTFRGVIDHAIYLFLRTSQANIERSVLSLLAPDRATRIGNDLRYP